MELYQVRCALEVEAVRRTIDISEDHELKSLEALLNESEPTYTTCEDFSTLARMDEDFHIALAEHSRNTELVSMLNNVNEKIRYVRVVNLRQLRQHGEGREYEGLSAHRMIVEAVVNRDKEAATTYLRRHIERRSEEVVELVKLAFSELYVPR